MTPSSSVQPRPRMMTPEELRVRSNPGGFAAALGPLFCF